MLHLPRILRLILVRLGGIRATTLQNGAGMVSTTAMIHTIRHRKMIARGSDNGKKNLGENIACRNLDYSWKPGKILPGPYGLSSLLRNSISIFSSMSSMYSNMAASRSPFDDAHIRLTRLCICPTSLYIILQFRMNASGLLTFTLLTAPSKPLGS